jgi:hypothetical protein
MGVGRAFPQRAFLQAGLCSILLSNPIMPMVRFVSWFCAVGLRNGAVNFYA